MGEGEKEGEGWGCMTGKGGVSVNKPWCFWYGRKGVVVLLFSGVGLCRERLVLDISTAFWTLREVFEGVWGKSGSDTKELEGEFGFEGEFREFFMYLVKQTEFPCKKRRIRAI